ncbi:MAG: Na/Pi cotransporter family protein [Bacteroidales bacterium]|nr:Na/Pi cotransporter family protein [Bacteroidales bacterium]
MKQNYNSDYCKKIIIFITLIYVAINNISANNFYKEVCIDTNKTTYILDTLYTINKINSITFKIKNLNKIKKIDFFSNSLNYKFITNKINDTINIKYTYELSSKHHIAVVKLITINNTYTIIQTINYKDTKGIIFTIFTLVGGLFLFLFGIKLISDTFIDYFRNRVSKIVQQTSTNSLYSFNYGALLTTLFQSSSAVSIFLSNLVNHKIIKIEKSLPLIAGAALGTTITLQIIALRLNNLAFPLLSCGLFFVLFFKKSKIKQIGLILTGFGLLYSGLLFMSSSSDLLNFFPNVIKTLCSFDNIVLAILVGLIITAIIQSPTAFIGLLIIIGSKNILPLQTAIALLIGSNIGSSLPVIISSVKMNNEAKKVALFHTVYRILGALIFVFWLEHFSELVKLTSNYIANNEVNQSHLIANAHTFMYVIISIIFFPFLNVIYKTTERFTPIHENNEYELKNKYINENALYSSEVAILLAKKETIYMAKVVKEMIETILPAFIKKDRSLLLKIELQEKLVNYLRDSITEYIIKINKLETLKENEETYKLLLIVKELEQIADIISTNLLPKARYWTNTNYEFSEQGKNEITQYHRECLSFYCSVINVIENKNKKEINRLLLESKKIKSEAIEFEKSHFTRILDNVNESILTSKTHLEIIGLLQATARHAKSILRILQL